MVKKISDGVSKAASRTTLGRPLYLGLLLLLILMPFHAFLTTWAGTTLDHRAFFQAWKEILLVGMSLVALVYVIKDSNLRQFIFSYTPNRLIALYIFLHVALTLILRPGWNIAAFGLKTNLGFLVLFVLAQIAAYQHKRQAIAQTLERIIIAGGITVGVIGLLQVTLLPSDILRHFGYGAGTIQPFLTVSENQGLRILSTLGGPNQLGQYLILPLAVLLAAGLKHFRWWMLAAALPMLISLWFSYSRSAWLGLLLAVVVILARRLRLRTVILSSVVVAIVVGGLAVASFYGSNSSFKRVIFHASTEPGQHDSNSDHIIAIGRSVRAIGANPLGYGPGTSGPASIRDKTRTGFIGENYYLQLGIEVGVVGLIIFLMITILVGLGLWHTATQLPLAAGLLGTLAAVSLINVVLHGWTDSSIALLWWGSAGAIIRKAG